MPDAIVLGGGGAKGAFTVGALLRLYEVGIRPSIICGASAGSLNALKLAEAPQDPTQPLKIHDFWAQIRTTGDMYALRPWLGALSSDIQELVGEAGLLTNNISPSPFDLITLINVGLNLNDLNNALKQGMNDSAIYDLAITQRRLRSAVNEAAVSASSAELFLAVTHFATGQLRFVNKFGVILDRDLNPVPGLPAVSLVDAAVASCSTPIFFTPAVLAGELYQDGGVRANVPVQTAIQRGATRIFEVLHTRHPLGPSMSAKLPDIAARLPDVMMDEMVFQQLRLSGVPPGTTVTTIAPLQDMHSGLEVDPGLVAIDVDYGYMRAADTLSNASTNVVTITEQLVSLRYQIWKQEVYATAPDGSASIGGALTVRQLKQQLAGLAGNRRDAGGVIPPGIANWWQMWEGHSWTPLFPSPWGAYSFVGGANMPTGTAPPAWGPPPWPVSPGGAWFVQQTVPSNMTPGGTYEVFITMQNTGNVAWTSSGNYQLGSQLPQDNITWGINRCSLPPNLPVLGPGLQAGISPGMSVTFDFTVTAPAVPGVYQFQWRMLQGGSGFGDPTHAVAVTVAPPPPVGAGT
jgi:NTE family protein